MTRAGRLIYVVGPSGVGKDALIGYARTRLAGRGPLFAHRYITRPVDPVGENHVALSADEFADRRAFGCFLMAWHSHGWDYGIGIEVASWLDAGADVVVNGSRAYLPEARKAVARLVPVFVTAPPAVLRERLLRRGREDAAAIAERIVASKVRPVDALDAVVIDNGGALESAGERVISVITGDQAASAPAG